MIAITCFVFSIAFIIYMDASWKAKVAVAVLYLASWFMGQVIETVVPVGLIIQVGLCIFFVFYYKLY